MNIPTNQQFFYKKLDIVKLIVLLYFFLALTICHSNFSNRLLTMLPLYVYTTPTSTQGVVPG